jgi:hypothetical protein
MTKKIGMALCMVLCWASFDAAVAQKSNGYLFGGLGGASDGGGLSHLGSGGEGILYKGFGLGAEVGYLSPLESFRDGFGVLSTNATYHFPAQSRKTVPFITGGYSLLFRDGTANAANFGGGVIVWTKPKTGIRFEFRDLVWERSHLMAFRVGLTFR